MSKNIFILGRQPELGIAELERLIGSDSVKLFNTSVAISDEPITLELANRLGGTQKIAEILYELPFMQWREIEDFIRNNLSQRISDLPPGKIKLGISVYNLKVSPIQINGFGLSLKKQIKSSGRSIRIIPNGYEALSTAQVLHNKLTSETGFELIISVNNTGVIIAKTIFIQDINGYSSRDQNRPKRDAKVGMLPPKLAQIMINIANPAPDSLVLDPFCGTGVVLQEALLMGYRVYGTDIDERMIEYSNTNLKWINDMYSNLAEWQVESADATTSKWQIKPDSVVSETYLGKPLFKLPNKVELENQRNYINDLLEKFLINLGSQIDSGTNLCLAVPAWVLDKGFLHLPLLDHLEKIGYNHLSFKSVDTNS